ncbi:hypothetical protein JTE90_023906 [Oedothorax gibbosus]|uniref:Gustatory receptor n=1 Tax=Oedothorax gibbosus TaxID=931172 RepID=A0AAV6UNG0_9ARAC|nr:hypothetical protein JTE90_023906 [Oedothorax gibbosus]
MSFAVVGGPDFYWKSTIGYVTSVSFIILLMFLLQRKKEQMTNLLRCLQASSMRIDDNQTNLIVIVILFLCPSFYSFLTVVIFVIQDEKQLFTFYFYGYRFGTTPIWMYVITFIKCLYVNFVYQSFGNLVTVVYCKFCRHCSLQLRQLNVEIKNCPPKSFTPSRQLEILQNKRRILDNLFAVEENLSSPSLVLCLALFVSCMASLGSFLTNIYSENSIFEYVDVFYTLSNGLLALSAIFGTAGQVPIEIEDFGVIFQRKLEDRMFTGIIDDNIRIGKCFIDNPRFVLSGLRVIFYTRDLILTTIGTILTYALLVMNLHTSQLSL